MINYNIIDAHCHVYPDKIAAKAAQSIGGFYSLKIRKDGTLGSLLNAASEAKLIHMIICSVATKWEQAQSINNFILDITKNRPEKFSGLITLHPDMPLKDIENNIKLAKDNNLKGIKLHPDFQKFDIDCKDAFKIYSCAEGVLPILFHTGDDRYEYSRPHRLAKILKRFKNLTAVAAHFGGYSRWDEIKCYEDLPNIYFDTSSSLFKLASQRAVEIIDFFGADRFMFGSDYPMWTAKQELERFLNLNLGEQINSKILFENAIKVYGINKRVFENI